MHKRPRLGLGICPDTTDADGACGEQQAPALAANAIYRVADTLSVAMDESWCCEEESGYDWNPAAM